MLFVNCLVLPLCQASICLLHPQDLGLRSVHVSIEVKNKCVIEIQKKDEKTVCISHGLGLNEPTLHITHQSAAKMEVNVDSVSSVSILNIADDQDKECSSKVAQNEQTAISCFTKMYRDKKNVFFRNKTSPLL